MLITSDKPIVPERVLYFGDGAGSGKFGSTVSRGSAAPVTRIALPTGDPAPDGAGTQAAGNQEFITLLNPTTTAPRCK